MVVYSYMWSRHSDQLHICACNNWSPMSLTLVPIWHLSLHPVSKETLKKQTHLDILCCSGGNYLFCALGYANSILILQWAYINIIFVVMLIVFGDSSV